MSNAPRDIDDIDLDKVDRLLEEKLNDRSPMRKICSFKRSPHSLSFTTLDMQTGKQMEVAPRWGELNLSASATQNMVEDALFDLEDWLAGEFAGDAEREETPAFISGTGVNQPLGLLCNPTSTLDDKQGREAGTIQEIQNGGEPTYDGLSEMVWSLKQDHRRRACWLMNSRTMAVIRNVRAGDATLVWSPSISGRKPEGFLLGYPVMLVEDMPDIEIDQFPIAFGNFLSGYLIAERPNANIVRGKNGPFVRFSGTKRIGGALMDSEAIKLMRIMR